VLVALIQGVVGPFHEDFRPLNEARGKETGKGADEDFLEEGGVHPFLKATIVPAGGSLYELSHLHVRERD